MEFLLIVVGVAVVGVAVLLIRNRTPKSMESSISEFERRRRALDPERGVERERSPGWEPPVDEEPRG